MRLLLGAAPGALLHPPTPMNRLFLLAALVAGLTGCAELGVAQDVFGSRYPDRDRYPDRRRTGQYEDYARTTEYRRITSDADAYARRVGDALRLDNGQERRIRDLLVDRTARLLQRTSPRDHREAYPFPRDFRYESRSSRAFWAQADRDIERLLGRRDADAYRRYVRAGGRSNGRYDDRYGRRDGDRYDRRRDDDGERGRVWGDRPGDDRRDDRDDD
jgi:hypothetical protein